MDELLQQLLQKIKDKEQRVHYFLEKLKKKKPKNLDMIMQEAHQDAFEKIDMTKRCTTHI